ncbi:MAG: helix-turn-helix transcriptional regulator [Pirellulales bacterium]
MPDDHNVFRNGEATDGEFAVSSRKAANLSQEEAAVCAGLPIKRLREAEKRSGPLDKEERERLAKAYGVSDPTLFIRKKGLPESLLLQAGGLCGEPPVEEEGDFQDFECSTSLTANRVNCPVAVLWGDSRFRSYVHANVCFAESPPQGSYLRIAFRNGAGPYPTSVGIHPKHMIARRLSRHQLGFRFRAQLLQNANPTRPLCIVVRVSDAAHRQWKYYTKRAVQHVFPLGPPGSKTAIVEEDADEDRWRVTALPQKSAWTQIEVRTKGGSVDHQWSPFLHDERIANLDVITRISLEIGTHEDTERPRGGEGVVLISPIEIMGTSV